MEKEGGNRRWMGGGFQPQHHGMRQCRDDKKKVVKVAIMNLSFSFLNVLLIFKRCVRERGGKKETLLKPANIRMGWWSRHRKAIQVAFTFRFLTT